MKQPEQKQCIQNRIRAWLSRRKLDLYDSVLIVGVAIALYLFAVYGEATFLDFLVSFVAGILGIIAGLGLDRRNEQRMDNRVKNDFLALMRNELTEIKGKIPPQTKTPVMLYPEVWDSFVASGLMRMLSAEQVTKLSSVYRFVKGTRYEAEWVRRRVEEHEGLPDTMKAEKEFLHRRCTFLQESYERHGKQLTKEIDEILKETWLG